MLKVVFEGKNVTELLSHFFNLYTVGLSESRDFMAIVLYGGFIRVVISLGAKPLTLTISRGPRLDDGEWHSVEVRQELKVLRYTLISLVEMWPEICKNHIIWLITTIPDNSMKTNQNWTSCQNTFCAKRGKTRLS